jgi:hypothetical protein
MQKAPLSVFSSLVALSYSVNDIRKSPKISFMSSKGVLAAKFNANKLITEAPNACEFI